MNSENCLDIVFLGGLFPKAAESDIVSNSIGIIDNAANTLQTSLVKGLDANLGSSVKIINSLYIGSYPKRYRKPKIATYAFNHAENSSDINVGFVNVVGYKHLSRFFSLRPHLFKWATDKSKSRKVIIAYACTSIFIELLAYVKRINPDIITISVIPDLPQYMDTSSMHNISYYLLRSLSMQHIKHKLHNIDGFVLLTKHMIDALELRDKTSVIIEGVANQPLVPTDAHAATDDDHINIVYTGTLNAKYGILNLVEAFKGIDGGNYRLILCGAGDSIPLIEDAARADSRIVFLGQVKKGETLKIQHSATMLVNPRQNTEDFTKYSFPSKIMEYLACGKPVIAYKLDGMPDEYDQYIHYVPDNSIVSLRDKLIEISRQPTDVRNQFGEISQNWVLTQKGCAVQSKKIIEMIHGISDRMAQAR